MARQRYLVAYDIRDPVRLRRVHATMRGYGFALQYSVFICDLDFVEKVGLRVDLGDIINAGCDSVALVRLGDPA
jgi:CRISPR-associated protein Cas2